MTTTEFSWLSNYYVGNEIYPISTDVAAQFARLCRQNVSGTCELVHTLRGCPYIFEAHTNDEYSYIIKVSGWNCFKELAYDKYFAKTAMFNGAIVDDDILSLHRDRDFSLQYAFPFCVAIHYLDDGTFSPVIDIRQDMDRLQYFAQFRRRWVCLQLMRKAPGTIFSQITSDAIEDPTTHQLAISAFSARARTYQFLSRAGMSHGDFHEANCFWDDSKRTFTIIDVMAPEASDDSAHVLGSCCHDFLSPRCSFLPICLNNTLRIIKPRLPTENLIVQIFRSKYLKYASLLSPEERYRILQICWPLREYIDIHPFSEPLLVGQNPFTNLPYGCPNFDVEAIWRSILYKMIISESVSRFTLGRFIRKHIPLPWSKCEKNGDVFDFCSKVCSCVR
jgi:hypothetical protein